MAKLNDALKERDIQLRIGTTKVGSGFSILLYKDARVDARRLTEVFGLSWKNSYRIDQNGDLICKIEVLDGERWISREDVGTESNIESVKGAHSDAFKRAGFKFGIGAELYEAPFIWIRWGSWKGKKPKGAFLKNWTIKFLGKDLSDGFQIKDNNSKVRFSTNKTQQPPREKTKKSKKKSKGKGSGKLFERTNKIGVGKMKNVLWKDVDVGYLNWCKKNTDGWLKDFALKELEIRNSDSKVKETNEEDGELPF